MSVGVGVVWCDVMRCDVVWCDKMDVMDRSVDGWPSG